MLVIVGHKITMQQGDDCSFRIIIKDLKGEEIKLSKDDIITMRIRRRRKPGIVLTKTALPIYKDKEGLSDELIHIFEFNSSDTLDMTYGDYIYDVTLESDGKRYTIIPKAVFSVELSVELADSYNNENDASAYAESETNLEDTISPTPLVGVFSYIDFNRTYIDYGENNIILF